MNQKKKRYSAEFKAQVVLELLRGGQVFQQAYRAVSDSPGNLECMAQGLSGTGTDSHSTGAYSTGQGNHPSERGDQGSPKGSRSTHH